MYKLANWIYKLGYDKARAEVFKVLESERYFHSSQAQIKSLQPTDSKFDMYKDRTVTSNDHDQRCKEVDDIFNRLGPKKYPNIDAFLGMLK